MKLSFVVPVYNAERYLHQCVDSLLGQHGADFEIVLSDDGSTDGSAAICDEYAASYANVRVLHSPPPNMGSCMARQRGTELACGEWIGYIDADDWAAENLLQTVAPLLDRTDLSMIQYAKQYMICGKATKTDRVSTGDFADMATFTRAGNSSPYITDCMFRRQRLIEGKFEFPDGVKMTEDWLLKMQYMLYGGGVCAIDAPLYCYRCDNTQSLTGINARSAKDMGDFLDCAELLLRRATEEGEQDEWWLARQVDSGELAGYKFYDLRKRDWTQAESERFDVQVRRVVRAWRAANPYAFRRLPISVARYGLRAYKVAYKVCRPFVQLRRSIKKNF